MDDLSDLDNEFEERLRSYFARLNDAEVLMFDRLEDAKTTLMYERNSEGHMAIKEACFDCDSFATTPEAAPLEDPWFWPNDEQPINRADELEPFWR